MSLTYKKHGEKIFCHNKVTLVHGSQYTYHLLARMNGLSVLPPTIYVVCSSIKVKV